MAENQADVYKGWTVQTNTLIPTPEATPGQVFTKAELPDTAKVKANGFDPAILENLWVEPEPAAPAPAPAAKADKSA